MLAELISRLALSDYFKYGAIGKWYVGSGWHAFSRGDLLVDKLDPRRRLTIINYHIELLDCYVGMYDVIESFERTSEEKTLPKSFVEMKYRYLNG